MTLLVETSSCAWTAQFNETTTTVKDLDERVAALANLNGDGSDT